MMTTSRLRLLMAFFMLASLDAFAADLQLGAPAPIIKAKLMDTQTVLSTGPEAGKVTIINFWATWCAPCKAEMPAIHAYYDKHKAQGLEVLAISMDEPRDIDKVRQFAKSFSFPVALKSEADFKGLGRIWRMPTTFVVDKHGLLRKNGQVGEPSVDLELLETLLTPLLTQP